VCVCECACLSLSEYTDSHYSCVLIFGRLSLTHPLSLSYTLTHTQSRYARRSIRVYEYEYMCVSVFSTDFHSLTHSLSHTHTHTQSRYARANIRIVVHVCECVWVCVGGCMCVSLCFSIRVYGLSLLMRPFTYSVSHPHAQLSLTHTE